MKIEAKQRLLAGSPTAEKTADALAKGIKAQLSPKAQISKQKVLGDPEAASRVIVLDLKDPKEEYPLLKKVQAFLKQHQFKGDISGKSLVKTGGDLTAQVKARHAGLGELRITIYVG